MFDSAILHTFLQFCKEKENFWRIFISGLYYFSSSNREALKPQTSKVSDIQQSIVQHNILSIQNLHKGIKFRHEYV